MHGSTEIPLHNNHTLTFMRIDGDPWQVDIDPLCTINTRGYPHGSEWWWIVSDGPINITAKTMGGHLGASIIHYTLDTPLPLPEVGTDVGSMRIGENSKNEAGGWAASRRHPAPADDRGMSRPPKYKRDIDECKALVTPRKGPCCANRNQDVEVTVNRAKG